MKKTLIALAIVAAAPLSLAAQELNYNFIEAGYFRTNLSGGFPNADGWGVGGSVALGSNFQLFGEYSNQELSRTSIDYDQWRIGFGYRHGLSSNADLLARIAYEKVDFGSGFDADGYSAEVGVRGSLAPSFEGWVLAGYSDSSGASGDFYGRLGGQYKFNRQWGISAEARFADGANTFFIGPRLSF